MNFTKDDWINIHRKARWHNSLQISLISDFLGISSKDILSSSKTYESTYHKNLIAIIFEDFLNKHNYKIEKCIGIVENDYYALKKQDIEISPGKFKRCITEGYMFITHEDYKFVLEFDGLYGHDKWGMNLFYAPKDEGKTLSFLNNLEKYAEDNNYLKNAKISPDLSHMDLKTVYSWDDIVLPNKLIKEIKTNVDNLFNNINKYKDAGVKFKRGIILQGVPGTGKTMIGKILCHTAKCSFIWVTPRFLTRSDHVAQVCTLARSLSPTILFLEDIDLYGGSRNESDNRGILGELMNQLDGLIENEYVVVIATTNNVKHIESAIRNRPGRFDRVIEIPKPNAKERKKLLELYTKDFDVKNVDFDKIAKYSQGYTGAHMRELVTAALIEAIDSDSKSGSKVLLTNEQFDANFDKVKDKDIKPVGFGAPKDDDEDYHHPSVFE
ncbi:MAG: ATP-binding protein [Deltaproteobacteria bacterium]|nr:MAG: ATP-binding protein [Deltaproteobacteria bacterium]